MSRSAAPRPDRLRLDVLGRMSLRRGEDDIRAVLVQPKRLGLLAYIVLRRPGDFVRRDELLGAFWAESSESRGRGALRQALRFLRRHLGADVVVNRGDSDVGIRSTVLTSDALEFVRAVDRGKDEIAVDRYGGDLLPGLVVEGAWEFDRWLHAERQRLRGLAVRAALQLAGRAEEAGEVAAAADRVRWAHRLEPTDEAVGRRLISLLARSGNRSAAVAAYEALAERLADELELEPSPETVELFDAVRDPGRAGRLRDEVGPRARSLSPQRVLVLELENLSGDDTLDPVGRLAADTLAQGLATIPDLEVVPPMALGPAPSPRGAEGTRGGSSVPNLDAAGLPAPLVQLARRTGAGTILAGAFHLEQEDTLRFQVRITDVVGGKMLQAPEPIRVDRSTPVDGVERLRERVMTTLAPSLSRRVVHVRQATRPPGMEAYRAYLDGLERFIRRDWRRALAHFRRSTRLEPDYALPRIVSSIALWNLGELEAARSTAMEADDRRHSLGRFERAVLDMVVGWLRGNWAAARLAALQQAEMAPGSIPHVQVAEEARRLNRPREAREVLGRLDSEAGELRGWVFYWVELANAHHLVGDHARELEVAHRARRLHPDDTAVTLLEIRALAGLGRAADVVRTVDQALSAPSVHPPLPGELMFEAALELRAHGAGAASEPLFQRAVAWYRGRVGPEAPDPARRELARTLYHAGDLDRARSIFRELAPTSAGRVQPVGFHHGHLQAHLDEGYLAVIAEREGDTGEAARWCTFLEELDGPFLYGAPSFWLAAVHALRNDGERTVRALRRAFTKGLPMEMFIHSDPHLAALRGYAPLEALLRPRG